MLLFMHSLCRNALPRDTSFVIFTQCTVLPRGKIKDKIQKRRGTNGNSSVILSASIILVDFCRSLTNLDLAYKLRLSISVAKVFTLATVGKQGRWRFINPALELAPSEVFSDKNGTNQQQSIETTERERDRKSVCVCVRERAYLSVQQGHEAIR